MNTSDRNYQDELCKLVNLEVLQRFILLLSEYKHSSRLKIEKQTFDQGFIDYKNIELSLSRSSLTESFHYKNYSIRVLRLTLHYSAKDL